MNARTIVDAMSLWEGTGTVVVQAARAVSGLLADHGMANMLAGGLAVQLHGYPRTTVDVDIIVPDVQAAHEFLLGQGYRASVSQPLAVIDQSRQVRIDLLPAGKCLKKDCEVPFPQPTDSSGVLVPVDLETLISLKLDSWKHSPARRLRDKTDAAELIMRNGLSRDLQVHQAVVEEYRILWDALASEPPDPLA